jgi:hypothetical protein
VYRIGDKALLPLGKFERLIESARWCEEIALQMHEADIVMQNLGRDLLEA